MSNFIYSTQAPEEISARCHEIQTGLGFTEVPDYDNLRIVGMTVRLALHIRGLPAVKFETLRMVGTHYLKIPSVSVKPIVEILADLEFVKIQTEGKTIKSILPNVPYYETMYSNIGTFASEVGFNEPEQLALDILCRLSKSPEKVNTLESKIGAEHKLFDRAIKLGREGAYLRIHRARGVDVALSPTYFSENAAIFADTVAGKGSKQLRRLMEAIKNMQGTPLSVIEKSKRLGGMDLYDHEINLLKRLAQNGAVKPPCISTEHAGENFFLFTPTPSGAALSPTKREVYEKAMAIVASVRQGQFLPQRYRIRHPSALVHKLKTDLRLGKSTSEANQQYKQLVHMRVAQLVPNGHGRSELHIIDAPENREALDIAYNLIDTGTTFGAEIDDDARRALQNPHEYIESHVASGELSKRHTIPLSQEQELVLDELFLS